MPEFLREGRMYELRRIALSPVKDQGTGRAFEGSKPPVGIGGGKKKDQTGNDKRQRLKNPAQPRRRTWQQDQHDFPWGSLKVVPKGGKKTIKRGNAKNNKTRKMGNIATGNYISG